MGYLSLPHRLDLYRAAVEKLVRPGDRVVDAGCGTAVLGLLCLQAGAAYVHAIDSTAAIEVARETLTRADWASKADFIRGSSFQVDLPERVDVVICDHVGYFGFDYGLIGLLADARKRFLKPGGKLIPGRLKLHIGAVESPKGQQLADAWKAPGIPPEFHWVRQHSVNSKHAVNLQRDELLTDPAELCCIDLQVDQPDFFSWSAQLNVQRDGVLHGLVGWFECELAEGVWMTNSPLSDAGINRSQAFLPIDEALPVKSGEVLRVTVMARPADHMIAWVVAHPASGRRFSHSTWQGDLLDREQIVRSHPEHIPRVSRTAHARSLVLGYCDGQRSVAQVQEAVLRDHPRLFPSREETARFITAVLSRDTQ
ncbi:MAG: class I SAM-dependent methyltransferase [Polaromonas sp.]|nr:class I SAM-dependent methyltransferase [Polaromonas sp.]